MHDRQPVDVEERRDTERDMARTGRQLIPRPALQRIGQQVAVGQHGALGDARRAAGVLQERDIIGRRWLRQRIDLESLAAMRWAKKLFEGMVARLRQQRLHIDGLASRAA